MSKSLFNFSQENIFQEQKYTDSIVWHKILKRVINTIFLLQRCFLFDLNLCLFRSYEEMLCGVKRISPHIQNLLFCLHQQVIGKDTHCSHKIHAPSDEENGNYGEGRNMLEIIGFYNFTQFSMLCTNICSDKASSVFSFICFCATSGSAQGTPCSVFRNQSWLSKGPYGMLEWNLPARQLPDLLCYCSGPCPQFLKLWVITIYGAT